MAQENSPVHLVNFSDLTQLWVKRDDLIDPFISGNKWRKLKYILQDAAQQQKKHLVTFGGAYSNHLVATAAAAARNGLKASAFVRGEKVTNEMLLCCELFGMQLFFVDRDNYRHKKQLFEQYFGEDKNAYFINEGGACEQAVKGCSEIIAELSFPFEHIFCAAGTGTTAAGLLRGINSASLSTQLHVIPVLKGGDFIADEISTFEKNTNNLHLHTNYHFGGYAKTTPDLIQFIKAFTATTGLLIDPVYTAKMFYAIYDLRHKQQLKADAKILAIHTGGLLGLMGMQAKF